MVLFIIFSNCDSSTALVEFSPGRGKLSKSLNSLSKSAPASTTADDVDAAPSGKKYRLKLNGRRHKNKKPMKSLKSKTS